MPFAASRVRSCKNSRPGAAPPRSAWILLLIGCAVALGGCLQDAQNQANGLLYTNPNDPGALASTSIAIVGVDYLTNPQTVYIVNSSGMAQDMTGWLLQNSALVPPAVPSPSQYAFSSFTFNPGTFVRVHSGVAPNGGADTATDLYAGLSGTNSPFPYGVNESALLMSNGGLVVSACTVGSPVC